MSASGYGVPFWDYENVPELGVVILAQLYEYTKSDYLLS